MAGVRLPAAPRPPVPDGVEPAFARSAGFWSRAYPRRWRAARGAELLGLLADLAAPGARHLDVRSAADLVRGGWATRLRERPPIGPWLLYRIFGSRALRDHLAWVADDIAGALFPLRQSVSAWCLLFVLDLSRAWSGGPVFTRSGFFWVVVLAFFAVDGVTGSSRRQAIRTHLVARPGERVTPGSWVRVRAPRTRVAAQAGLPWAAAATATTLLVCALAVVRAPETLGFRWVAPPEGFGFGAVSGGEVPRFALLAILVGAAVVGALLAALVSRRIRRADVVPAQPDRELVTVEPRRAVLVVLVILVVGALPVAEALGAVPLVTSVPLGIAGALLAPPTLVACRVLRRTPAARELALVDVSRIGFLARTPAVDLPGATVAPALPSEVGQIWPWPWSHEGSAPALG